MKAVLAVFLACMIFAVPGTAAENLQGYAFHQAMAEADLPPFYSEVEDDLGLSPEQQKHINSQRKRLALYIDQWSVLEAHEEDYRNITASLTLAQRTRLEEIRIQHKGPLYSLIRPSVQKKLGIATDQAESIQSLFMDFWTRTGKIPDKDSKGNYIWKEHHAAVDQLKAEYGEKAMKILGSDQKTRLPELAGPVLSPEPKYWRNTR
ncbi:MAG: hypothetical protein M3O22_02620 [Pseudomonadota bacterium]|nr:hypothetical protein [Pseudomonadota bacterium]